MTISVKLQNCVYYPTDICFSVQFAQKIKINFVNILPRLPAGKEGAACSTLSDIGIVLISPYTTLVHSVASRLGIIQASWYSSTLAGVSSSVEPR